MFAGVPLNLFSTNQSVCNNVVTGWWTVSSAVEQNKYGRSHNPLPHINKDNLIVSTLPPVNEWDIRDDAEFVHFCDNETASGFEFNEFPYEGFGDQITVSDVSSNIGSKPIDWNKLDVAYACAQKNIGVTGVTVLIAKRDVLESDPLPECPKMLSWKLSEHTSEHIVNTPDVAAVYMCNL